MLKKKVGLTSSISLTLTLVIVVLVSVSFFSSSVEKVKIETYKTNVKMVFKEIELLTENDELASLYEVDDILKVVSGKIKELGNEELNDFSGSWEYDRSNDLIKVIDVYDGNFYIEEVTNKVPEDEWVIIKDLEKNKYTISYKVNGVGGIVDKNEISVFEGEEVRVHPLQLLDGYELESLELIEGNAFISDKIINNVKSDLVVLLKIRGFSFPCGEDLIDKRDMKVYSTVKIGTQCWFAENLRYTTEECLSADWSDKSASDACRAHLYDDKKEVLYQWDALMDGSNDLGAKGLCPTGWHVPTNNEFTMLERNICNGTDCRREFPFDETTTGYRGISENNNLKNVSGFNAYYPGVSGSEFELINKDVEGYYWTSTVYENNPIIRGTNVNYGGILRDTSLKSLGRSVRCVKN